MLTFFRFPSLNPRVFPRSKVHLSSPGSFITPDKKAVFLEMVRGLNREHRALEEDALLNPPSLPVEEFMTVKGTFFKYVRSFRAFFDPLPPSVCNVSAFG